MFDVIVPVYNSMHHVRACLNSVIRHSTLPFHLHVIDDGSDDYTKRALRELLDSYPHDCWSLETNRKNLGYLRTCNKGLRFGNHPYVVLLNSDAMVSEGYLQRLDQAFCADQSIGVINAVSTWANWTRIPFPSGFTVNELAREVRLSTLAQMPDINNASGFFFATRRSLIEELGLFDEAFDPGYYEETDFCMRALDAGYRVVVDDNLYVFHHGWGSFGENGRNQQLQKNRQIFLAKWGRRFLEIEREWEKENPLQPLCDHLADPLLWSRKRAEGANGRGPVLTVSSPPKSPNPLDGKKVCYILPAVRLYGGVISVMQLVNNMVLEGIDANIATCGVVDPQLGGLFPMYFRPYVFDNEDAMIDSFPDADLIIATHWSTVYSALQVATGRPEVKLAYFVQDFEPDCHSDGSSDYRRAERTYRLIPDRIVKTNWLKEMMVPYGGNTTIIPLGLQLDLFYPRSIPRRKRLLAMARPGSTPRNHPMLRQVYAELHRRRPDIELAVYGVPSAADFDCPVHCYGRLSDLQAVARAMSESMVLLDASTFQGFGRPGLEAMACGTAAVLTDTGGITEYAKHRVNCLLINPQDRDEIVDRVIEMFDDEPLRRRLITRGLRTAARYSDKAEVQLTIDHFRQLLGLAAAEPPAAASIRREA